MTSDELGNNMGYQCPKCKQGDALTISAVVSVEARLFPDGTDNDGGDTEWDDSSSARCGDCSWNGKVGDLITIELED